MKVWILGGAVVLALSVWWLWPRGQELATLRGHVGPVRAIAFGPEGLASAGDDGVRLWDLSTNRERAKLEHPKAVLALAYSVDGKVLATAGADGAVRLWEEDKLSATLPASSKRLHAVAFSAEVLAVAGDDRIIHRWTWPGREPLPPIKGHGKHLHALAFGGGKMASAGGDGLKLWDAKTGAPVGMLPAEGHVHSLAWHGGKLGAAGSGVGLRWWDERGEKKEPTEPPGATMGFAFSPDGTLIASSHEDGSVKVWGIDGTKKARLKGHAGPVLAVSFAPDGKTFASAGADGTVKRWLTPPSGGTP